MILRLTEPRTILAAFLAFAAAGCGDRVDPGPERVFLQARECLEKNDLYGYAALWDPEEPRFLLAGILRTARDAAEEPGPRAELDALLKKHKVRDVPTDTDIDPDEFERRLYQDVPDPVAFAVALMNFTKANWPKGRKPFVPTVLGSMTATEVRSDAAHTEVVMPGGKRRGLGFRRHDGRWYLGHEFIPW